MGDSSASFLFEDVLIDSDTPFILGVLLLELSLVPFVSSTVSSPRMANRIRPKVIPMSKPLSGKRRLG